MADQSPQTFPGDRTDHGNFWFDEANIPWRPSRPRRGLYGSARLANRKDLATLLEPTAHASEFPLYAALVEATADGGTLEPLVYRSLFLSEDMRSRHMLAIGQTGCGKTTRLIYPLLASDLQRDRVVIAFDAKGKKLMPLVEELAAIHRPGQKVHLLNFRDPGRSARWNPLTGIKTEGDAHDVAYKLCTMIDKGTEKDGAFWLNNSIDFLAGILLALATNPRETLSLGRARQVAQLSFAELAKFAKENSKVGELQRIVDLHKDVQTTAACVVQDLRMRLSGFMDEKVCETTSAGGEQLNLDSLILGGGVLVIEVNETDVGKLKQITNLFMNHLFTRLIALASDAPRGRLPRPVSLFLDEFASAVGRIDDMEIRLNTIRERGVSVVAAVQSLAQLAIYGSSAGGVLAGFASKVYFAGLEQSDAEYASRQAGVTTVLVPNDDDDNWQSSGGTPVPRMLLLPEEVARPVNHPTFGPPTTLFLADTPPMQAYLRPAYDMPILSRLLDPDDVSGDGRPDEMLKRRLRQLQRKMQLPDAGEEARAWWQEVEMGADLAGQIELLEKLEPLFATWRKLREPRPQFLDTVQRAVAMSGSRRLEGQLSFAQFSLLRRHEEEQLGMEPGRA